MHRKFFALAVLLTASSIARADFVIDDFTTGAQTATLSSGSTSISTSDASILGGTRTVNFGITANPFAQSSTATVTGGTPGLFVMNSGAGVDTVGSIVYDSGGIGLGGVDLAQYGSQFSIDVVYADLTLALGITVRDTFGVTSTVTFSGITAGILNYSFAGFAGVDLTSLASVSINFNAPASADFVLNFIGVTGNTPAVPEPASVALMGLGFVGAVAAARRRMARA